MANILAVDDSSSMRQMVSFTLKGAGHTVVEAVDAQDALNKAKSQKFDLVITDVNMPVMDGITFIKNLRAVANYKFTPMLMLTTESASDKKSDNRNNAVIGLGGGFSSQFASQLAADLKNLPDGKAAIAPPVEVLKTDGIEVKIVEKEAVATAISFGFPIDVLRGQPDYYALAVANSWLGEHRNSSSHLYGVIREARGLNYGDYSYIEHFPNGGFLQFPPANVARRQQLFEIWIRPVPNQSRLFAFRAALRELQKLVDNGMSEEEFKLTQDQRPDPQGRQGPADPEREESVRRTGGHAA